MKTLVWLLAQFTYADLLAFAWFLVAWFGYARYAERDRETNKNLMQLLTKYRFAWMKALVRREMRMGDFMLAGNIMRSVTFFASTTMIIIGGLIAVLGVAPKVGEMLAAFPLATPTTTFAIELKIILLVTIFVYGFFKFTWALRQFNYLSIFLGGAPAATVSDTEADDYARRGARLVELAAMNLNGGIRAYYFGMAVLSWFIRPELFALVTAWVVWVLYRREFRSRTRAVLVDAQDQG